MPQTAEATAAPGARSVWGDALRRFRHHPVGMAGLVMLAAIALLALIGPRLLPYSYAETDLAHTYSGPTRRHPCGTDNLGRDECVRLLYGARISLTVGLASALISLLVGVLYGAASGFYGGTVDLVLQRLVELLDAIPSLLYLILLLTVVEPGLSNVLLVLGATGWLGMARVVRGEVLSLREQDFVQAAVAGPGRGGGGGGGPPGVSFFWAGGGGRGGPPRAASSGGTWSPAPPRRSWSR